MAEEADAPRRRELALAVAVAAAAVVASGIVHAWDETVYPRFLGGVQPVLATLAAAVVGLGGLVVLRSRAGFRIVGRLPARRFLAVGAAATGFALTMIVADLRSAFPPDINVRLPVAALFYPAIGFLAEVAFHVIPLAALVVLLGPGRERGRSFWTGLTAIAIIEPVYQLVPMLAWGAPPLLLVWVPLHNALFNLTGLGLFVRYDFLTMYAFRLIYYALWHMGWGDVRLDLLFG